MNARLTPGLLFAALFILAAIGPLGELREITTADMQSRSYWLDMAAATIASFADAAIAIVGIVATALGLPAISARFRPTLNDVEPSGQRSGISGDNFRLGPPE